MGDPELDAAVEQFSGNYKRFVQANEKLIGQVDVVGLEKAVKCANAEKDVRTSARLFERKIIEVIESTRENRRLRNETFTGRMANFLAKLYPLTRTSLNLASAIAAVHGELRNFTD